MYDALRLLDRATSRKGCSLARDPFAPELSMWRQALLVCALALAACDGMISKRVGPGILPPGLEACDGRILPGPEPRVSRLSVKQYESSIEDLLGLPLPADVSLPPDPTI